MKLIQIMASNKPGGAERFFCRLADSLDQQPIEQTVMLRKDSPYVNQLSQLSQCTAPFGGLLDRQTPRIAKKLISQQRPDIILTWMNRASGLISGLQNNKSYQHIARLGGYYNLKYYCHCDNFVGNTKGICDYLIQNGISHNRVHYISNFASETPGTPRPRKHQRPLIAALGRLHTNKAFDTLIRAMTDIKDAELWIGGTGPEQVALEHLIQELNLQDRVKLLGWIDKPEDIIASCDVFVCPSRHEPLGNVILEAWAQNKPIVATQNQGACELITHGEDGLLSPLDQPQLLAKTINMVLESNKLKQKLATQGIASYQQRFSKASITQQYLNLLKASL